MLGRIPYNTEALENTGLCALKEKYLLSNGITKQDISHYKHGRLNRISKAKLSLLQSVEKLNVSSDFIPLNNQLKGGTYLINFGIGVNK